MKRVFFAVIVAAVLWPGPASAEEAADVVVGSKKFTENVILGEIAKRLVDAHGVSAEHRQQLGGTRVLWSALQRGDIDAYPEYTGTIDEELLPDTEIEGPTELREELAKRGVRATKPLGFNNTYAIGMLDERAEELGITKLSDLKDHPELALGFTNEFMDRSDGWKGLRRTYDLPHDEVEGLDHDLAYQGLEKGSIDVIDAYSTDAEIEYYDLRTLEDDRNYFPRYEALILYRADLSDRHPEAVKALKRLEGRIEAGQMTELNAAVKIDGGSEEQTAADFLQNDFDVDSQVSTKSMWARLWDRTLEHLFLVGVSMAGAILLSLPLGIWAARRRMAGQVILGAVGIMQTIPSLALLVFMIPLLGIGTWPAIAALFLYSLLPIVRNTHAGLADISRDIVDSARALGLPGGARLRLVELPLASRAILAGIKTSIVINIGTATLGALIGAGGYGQPILTGIRLDDMGLILEGAIPAALLALVAQWFFDGIEALLVTWE